MKKSWIGMVALVVVSTLTMASGAKCQQAGQTDSKPRLKILDTEPRIILLTGGGQLAAGADAQRFKDVVQHFYSGKSPHHIEAVQVPKSKDPMSAKVLAEVIRPALARAKEKKLPIVVLAQLPPLVMNPANEIVPRNEKDVERIRAYGDIFADYARLVRDQGADLVVLGMEGAVGPNKSEPAAPGSYVHLALVSDNLAQRSLPGVAVGPRMFQTFDKNRHLYMGRDHHITPTGKILVTQMWFQALCRLDGIAVPEWSQKEVEAALKK